MAEDDEQQAVSSVVHRRMDELTDSERRVARALLTDYPASGLGTSHSLAAAAGVSAPTVVRTAVKLGFGGFNDMQARLRDEVSEGASSPVLRTMAQRASNPSSTPAEDAMHSRMRAIEKTIQLVPGSELTMAGCLIADCPARVLVSGGFFSQSIARLMALQLSQIRPDVIFLEEPLRRDAGFVLDARRRSVFIIFDLRRYEPAALELAQHAKTAGCSVIVVTDRWMSPAVAAADVALPVEVDAVPFDTFVALLALVEVLVESVMDRRGDKALRRMNQWETHAVSHTRMAGGRHDIGAASRETTS